MVMDLEALEKIIEMVELAREDIHVGEDPWGEPEFMSVINANKFLDLLKREIRIKELSK